MRTFLVVLLLFGAVLGTAGVAAAGPGSGAHCDVNPDALPSFDASDPTAPTIGPGQGNIVECYY